MSSLGAEIQERIDRGESFYLVGKAEIHGHRGSYWNEEVVLAVVPRGIVVRGVDQSSPLVWGSHPVNMIALAPRYFLLGWEMTPDGHEIAERLESLDIAWRVDDVLLCSTVKANIAVTELVGHYQIPSLKWQCPECMRIYCGQDGGLPILDQEDGVVSQYCKNCRGRFIPALWMPPEEAPRTAPKEG